jgi:hypothetical protein
MGKRTLLLIAAVAVLTGTLATVSWEPSTPDAWWPDEALLELPAEIHEIPSLDDQEFMAEVRRTAIEIQAKPTDRETFRERADLARKFYNVLEANGFMVPRVALLGLNLVEARASDPDRLFRLYAGAIDAVIPAGVFLLEHGSEMGEVEVVRPKASTLQARSYTTIELVYRVGALGVPEGARFRFSGDWHCDISPMQFTRPVYPGYVTVRSSNPDVRLVTGMEYWNAVWGSLYLPGLARPTVTVLGGSLEEGDTVTFVLGDRSGGGPGLLVQSTAIDVMPIRVELSLSGKALEFLPVGEPHFSVHGGGPHHLRVVGPTTVRRGEPFTVRAAVEDAHFNRAVGGPSRLLLLNGAEQIAEAEAVEGNPAIFHFERLSLPDDASEPVYLKVTDPERTMQAISNPIVPIGADEPRLYWGQVHGHEAYTDGSGTAEWYMRYARDVGFLDFASLSAHDTMISELHLRDVLRATEKYNEPGRFVTLKGYEWTQDTRFGGHHNVYYRDAEQRIVPCYEAATIDELYRIQREANDPEKVLIIPHCHQPGDWSFNDAEMQRLVEIYSAHGSFEWFGRRYLEQGYHVGLMTASDDHTGHPGNNAAQTNNRTGQTAVFAHELTRSAIFDAMKARRVYGSTVARIYLSTQVEGAPMGTEVQRPRPAEPALRVEGRVAGDAPIARVVAVCNGKDSHAVDYLAAGEESNLVRIMVGSSSEPKPGGVLPPLDREYRLGRVRIRGATILKATALGLEGVGERFAQTGANQVDFFSATRGDEDGVLLELEQWPEDGVLVVELFEAPNVDPNGRGLISTRNAIWGEARLRPQGDVISRLEVPLATMADGAWRQQLELNTFVRVERVPGDLERYREFAFDVTDNVDPNGENYVYVRAEQIDDERAWSSPVWVSWAE